MGGSSQIMGLAEENARLKAENERVLSDNKLLIVKLNAGHIVRQNVEDDSYLEALNSVKRLEAENAKLRESVAAYDSAIRRLCDQTQGHVDCDGCVLGKNYRDEVCALDELRESVRGLGVEVDG